MAKQEPLQFGQAESSISIVKEPAHISRESPDKTEKLPGTTVHGPHGFGAVLGQQAIALGGGCCLNIARSASTAEGKTPFSRRIRGDSQGIVPAAAKIGTVLRDPGLPRKKSGREFTRRGGMEQDQLKEDEKKTYAPTDQG